MHRSGPKLSMQCMTIGCTVSSSRSGPKARKLESFMVTFGSRAIATIPLRQNAIPSGSRSMGVPQVVHDEDLLREGAGEACDLVCLMWAHHEIERETIPL